jgi:hypothetical protein
LRRSVSLVAVATLVGCHTITEELPTQPTPSPSAAPIAIPIIVPAPAPTPTPTPEPPTQPAPNPTPQPTPPPPSSSCQLPPQSPAYSCSRTAGVFLGDVERVLNQIVRDEPGIFNQNDKICPNCYRVLNQGRYTSGVVRRLEQLGYCAIWDGEEIAIKNTNTFNEQYDILTAAGYIRRGEGSYRATCRPAWF